MVCASLSLNRFQVGQNMYDDRSLYRSVIVKEEAEIKRWTYGHICRYF